MKLLLLALTLTFAFSSMACTHEEAVASAKKQITSYDFEDQGQTYQASKVKAAVVDEIEGRLQLVVTFVVDEVELGGIFYVDAQTCKTLIPEEGTIFSHME